jgi:hypothetical protein
MKAWPNIRRLVDKSDVRRWRIMKRVMSILLALAILTVFSLGCTGVSKDTKVKCPKCGAVFTVDEGLAEFQKKGL